MVLGLYEVADWHYQIGDDFADRHTPGSRLVCSSMITTLQQSTGLESKSPEFSFMLVRFFSLISTVWASHCAASIHM